MELTNCKKIHFSSRGKAKSYIKKWKSHGLKGKKFRVYRCDKCNGYHFTSCDSKQTQSIRENKA